ncbi:brain protein I3-like [Asterias rubens]|uniref:brain protein I3-like n=1 Tax=Asterias rubens TaxID=7604 RepID=UPI001454ECFB|nr:brain protein I3-like [Asterias rubens]
MSHPINSSGDKPPAYSPPSGQAYGEPPPSGQQPYGQPQPVNYPAGTPYQGGYQAGAPPGYQQATGAPPPQGSYVPAQPITLSTTNVVLVGGCPACRIGILEDDFTLLGVCCAVLFFPLGILCCLAMRQRRCQNCGAVFG